MKKLTALTIALTMLLSFAACSSEESGTAEADVTTTAAAAVKEETTTAPAETTTEETTTAEPVPEATPATDFEYEETDGDITITKYKGSDEAVIIPAEIDGKSVTAINSNAFKGCKNLADITLPESLTEIVTTWSYYPYEANIFLDGTAWYEAQKNENPLVIINNIVISGQDCSRAVEIPEGVTQISGGAFQGCTTITSVAIPSSLEKIGDSAFYSCERITDIVLPDSVSYIGGYAFCDCKALENVTFPNNIVEMGIDIFDENSNSYDTAVTPWLANKRNSDPLVIVNGNLIDGQKCSGSDVIPDTVKSIAAGAFEKTGITNVTIPNGITKIPDNLFNGCYNLTSVTIPDSVTEIGWSAFSECTSLTSITIPNSVTKISGWAFAGTEMKNITIPSSVTEIGDHALSCNANTITLSEGLKKMGSQVFTTGYGWVTPLTELTLPDSLESIAEDAFYACKFDVTYKGEVYFYEIYDELYAEINGN